MVDLSLDNFNLDKKNPILFPPNVVSSAATPRGHGTGEAGEASASPDFRG